MNKITQAEARRLRRHNKLLQAKVVSLTSTYSAEHVGTHIASLSIPDMERQAMVTASNLGYALAIRHWSGSVYYVYALPKTEAKP